MPSYISTFLTDLDMPPRVIPLPHMLFLNDADAYTFVVKVIHSSDPDCGVLPGNVSGSALIPGDLTVPLTGSKAAETEPVSVPGGVCQATVITVTIPQAALTLPGRVTVAIRLVDGDVMTTVLAATAKVVQTMTEQVIDPDDIIPDITTLLSKIADCEAAADEATDAAADARAVVQSSVRYDEAQTLTDTQKAQARNNIGAASTAYGAAPALAWAQGNINANGLNTDSSTVIRTPDILCAHAASTLRLTIANGYRAQLKIYGPTGTFIKTVPGIYDHITGDYLYSLDAGQRVRIVLRNAAGTAIVPSEASNIALEFGGNDAAVEIKLPSSSTTATITAFPGAIYTAQNTMTEIDFTPCNYGACGIIFKSGSTPTVLTLPQTVKMPDWWVGPEAGRTYEISIMDGVYGAVMSWTT